MSVTEARTALTAVVADVNGIEATTRGLVAETGGLEFPAAMIVAGPWRQTVTGGQRYTYYGFEIWLAVPIGGAGVTTTEAAEATLEALLEAVPLAIEARSAPGAHNPGRMGTVGLHATVTDVDGRGGVNGYVRMRGGEFRMGLVRVEVRERSVYGSP